MDLEEIQIDVCRKYDAVFQASNPSSKLGISDNFRSGEKPLNGLRHNPEANTCGWYIWAGEEFSDAPDFFKPLHVSHLIETLPIVLPYLGLAPGWRFLIAEDYVDVWFDAKLLIT